MTRSRSKIAAAVLAAAISATPLASAANLNDPGSGRSDPAPGTFAFFGARWQPTPLALDRVLDRRDHPRDWSVCATRFGRPTYYDTSRITTVCPDGTTFTFIQHP